MKMLYTANGRYIRCCTEEGTRPVIIVCEKEYEVDVQEFMLWSILNWRILREDEIGSYYEKLASNTNVTIHRSWQDCVQRLLVRGLIVAGTGDTEYDALYDLLACRGVAAAGAVVPQTDVLGRHFLENHPPPVPCGYPQRLREKSHPPCPADTSLVRGDHQVHRDGYPPPERRLRCAGQAVR